MARKIKFRAWDTNTNTWAGMEGMTLSDTRAGFVKHREFSGCGDESCCSSGSYNNKCPELIFEQFTGFHDKNGEEIFEEDICKYWMDDVWKVGFIRWGRGGYEMVVTKMGDRATDVVFKFQSFIPCPGEGETEMSDSFEVIGNLHENPELLTSKTGEGGV